MSLIDENGIPVWEAETSFDPDEPVENQHMIMCYKGKKYFYWAYQTVEDALNFGVKDFLIKSMPFETFENDVVIELEIFFKHWITLANNGCNISDLTKDEE